MVVAVVVVVVVVVAVVVVVVVGVVVVVVVVVAAVVVVVAAVADGAEALVFIVVVENYTIAVLPEGFGRRRRQDPGREECQYLYYRGLTNYLYYFGGSSFLYLWYNGPPNLILIIKAPIVPLHHILLNVHLQKHFPKPLYTYGFT